MLSVWLPLNGDLHNQGLSNITAINNGATVDNNGKIGKCYSFDGNDDFINLGNIGSYFDGSAFSICFWIYSLENKTRAAVFSSYGLSSTSNFFGLELNSSNNNYCNNNLRFDWLGSDTYSPDDFVTYDAWTHICVTYDGVNQIKMYKNGVLIQTSTRVLNAIPVGNIYYLGRDSRTGTTALNGKINDFRIYDHCLSPRECKQVSTALVLHYPLNRGGFGGDNLFKVNCCSGGARATFLEDGKRVKINWTSNIGDTYWFLGLASGVTLTQGETYTLSFQCSGLGSNTVSFRWCNLANYDVFLKNGLNTYTFQMPSTNITNPFFDDINRDTNLSDLELWNFKLEKGSTATPWIPATSDALYSQMGLDNNIEYDVSGYGNNGTRNGTFSWSGDTPRYNTSTYVNSSSSIDHPRCLSNDDQEWTCCAWVKLDNSTSYQELNNFNRNNAVIYVTTPLMYLNEGANDYYRYGSQIVPVDEWTHIAFVFKNSTGLRNIYINGILKNNYGPNKTSTPYGIPDSVTLFGQNFAGYVSDYREYATALSPQDVRDLYAVGASISDSGTLMASEVSEV